MTWMRVEEMEKKMQKCAEDPKERMTTPQADGFFMPGEYEPHDGCILIWPSRPGSWIYGARDARIAFRDVIAAIAQSENVYVAAGRDARLSDRVLTTAEAEKAVLKAENESLTDKLEKSQQQSTLKKLQDAKLQSDYEAAQAVLERIPPDIIKAYTQRGNRERKVDQYSALE